MYIEVAGIQIEVTKEVAVAAGYEMPYQGEGKCRPLSGLFGSAERFIMRALSEKYTGIDAVLRGIALLDEERLENRKIDCAREVAEKNVVAARMELEAARVRRETVEKEIEFSKEKVR